MVTIYYIPVYRSTKDIFLTNIDYFLSIEFLEKQVPLLCSTFVMLTGMPV